MNTAIYWIGIASSAALCLACDRNQPTHDTEVSPATADPSPHHEKQSMNDVDNAASDTLGDPTADSGRPLGMKDKAQTEAKAEIRAAEGTKIDGEARFTDNGQGVTIAVKVKDAPVGEKGIHIHEKGDCSDIAGKSMGGHFAPQGDKHGLPGAAQNEIHLGDLGNIPVKDDGTGTLEITVKEANLKEGDPMSLLGKALVIHQDKDKGASEQPSGGSGTPIACGVIKKS